MLRLSGRIHLIYPQYIHYQVNLSIAGACLYSSFIFKVFENFEEFQSSINIDDKNIFQLDKPIEIIRAGIIDNEVLLKTPWGDKRLADKAVNK